jgi:hypothetical protein
LIRDLLVYSGAEPAIADFAIPAVVSPGKAKKRRAKPAPKRKTAKRRG